jgi:cytochrome c oxidase assembly protein subunit 11
MADQTHNQLRDGVRDKNRKLSLKLLGAAVLMFGFGFAMVPLYDVFCEITGLNGKTGSQVYVTDSELGVDTSRKITVQFLSVNNESAQLGFGPRTRSVTVTPGEVMEIAYFATNLTNREMKSHSVPSVSPQAGAQYLKKMECFCFQEQVIAVGETKEMPLRFYIDKDMPASITKLTLNYTIFDITEPLKEESQVGQNDPSSNEGHHAT